MRTHFFEPSVLNIHTKLDVTMELQQLAFDYQLRKSGDDGKEENDGMLILRIGTNKYWAVLSMPM